MAYRIAAHFAAKVQGYSLILIARDAVSLKWAAAKPAMWVATALDRNRASGVKVVFCLGPVRTTEDSLAAQVVSERRFFASRRVLRPSDGDNGA